MSDVGVDVVERVVPENVVSLSVFAFGHSHRTNALISVPLGKTESVPKG